MLVHKQGGSFLIDMVYLKCNEALLDILLILFNILTCLFRVSQLGAGKTQSLRRGERGSRDGEVGELFHVVAVLVTLAMLWERS